MLRFFLFSLPALFFSCATPSTERPQISLPEIRDEITVQARNQFREYMEKDYRVKRIKDRLLYASRGICKNAKFEYGFLYFDPRKLRIEHPVQNILLLDYMEFDKGEIYPVVTYIRQGSSAQKSGLKKGDRILRWEGKSVLAKYKKTLVQNPIDLKIVRTKFTWTHTFEKMLEKSSDKKEISLKIKRHIKSNKDTTFILRITKKIMCDNSAFYIESSGVNAYTDGENIGVTEGMLSFVSDNELALVIAHELAHCFEKHISKKKRNALLGGFAGAFFDGLVSGLGIPTYGRYQRIGELAGTVSFSQEFELEADYVGLYIMARAGYSTKNAANFWRRMAKHDPLSSNSFTGSHPPTSERYLLLSKTHLEIENKIANGEKLIPNRMN